ncbi:hypothetical protein [Amycolatopsis thermoflava]|uniref:hypothetical protein n=1 Tax=Amycolatopsis thermoflava TaxID=84480 RepID=UPI003F4A453D
MLKFSVLPAAPLAGLLRYSRSDRAFGFQPRNPDDLAGRTGCGGRTSLVAGTLQLEVAVDTGEALYVWGYLPTESWRRAALSHPDAVGGRVKVELDGPALEAGVSETIAPSDWEVLFDQDSGLVRVVQNRWSAERVVEIADGVRLGLSGASLNSFWLAPEFTE